MENKIQEMLDLGGTERSVSPYSVVLVPKKDGSIRFWIDFRKLNKVTEFDAEQMPNMEEVINKLSGHTYFSKTDLSKGYLQVELSNESNALTAFETPWGLFQFKAIPFGLVNAGASFFWENHMTYLRQVLNRLRSAKLTA